VPKEGGEWVVVERSFDRYSMASGARYEGGGVEGEQTGRRPRPHVSCHVVPSANAGNP